MAKETESALDSYKLAQKYPHTLTKEQLYGITEYNRYRLPWEEVEMDGHWLTTVSADRIYEARVYWQDGEMHVEMYRWYCDRPAKMVYNGTYKSIGMLGKSSRDTRLLTLRDQYTRKRMSELSHLYHLSHSYYCIREACPYAVPKTTEEQWEEMVALELKADKRWRSLR